MRTHAQSKDGLYHNEEFFDEPEVFNPDRYLQSKFGTKPGVGATAFRDDFHFGGGRVRSSSFNGFE